MKIWQAQEFGDPAEVLKLIDLEPPAMGADSFKLEVLASGVGLPDFFMIRGGYPLVTKPPISPGGEIVGRVVEAGPDSVFKLGDRVMTTTNFSTGFGGYAEYFVGNSSAVSGHGLAVASLAPEGLSDHQAAGFLIPYHTAHGALVQRARIEAGHTVLVLGASGSSGSAAIQVAKAVGAKVIASVGGEGKIAFCQEMGADHVINYREEDVAEKVREYTDGKGADIIFDPVGGKPAQKAAQAIAHDGQVVLIGFASGEWFNTIAADLVGRSYSAVGAFMGARTPEQIEEAKSDLSRWVEQGLINPPVDTVYDFDAVPEMLRRLESSAVNGKLVLRVRE